MAAFETIVLLAAIGLVVFVAAYQGTIRALRDFHDEGPDEGWVKRSDQ